MDLKHLKNLGFCPVHRHPVLANYIDILHTLLFNEISNCLQSVDFAKAQPAYPMEEDPVYRLRNIRHLDYIYDEFLVSPSELLGQGLHRSINFDTGELTQTRISCKGFSFHPCGYIFIINSSN